MYAMYLKRFAGAFSAILHLKHFEGETEKNENKANSLHTSISKCESSRIAFS